MHFLTLIVLFEYFAEVNTFVVSIVSKKIHVSEFNKKHVEVIMVENPGRILYFLFSLSLGQT